MNQNEVESFVASIKCQFSDEELRAGGKIFYTGPRSIRPGGFAILGLNPAETRDAREKSSLADNLANFAVKTCNDNYHVGDRLGRGFTRVLSWIGGEPADVFTSNVIFRRSSSKATLGRPPWDESRRCWPVLQQIFAIVKPRLFITCGSGRDSAYSYTRDLLFSGSSFDESRYSAGHGNWRVCCARGSVSGRSVSVIGIPHFSYYVPKLASQGMKILVEEINLVKSTIAQGQ
jgi:uracil-DNA glycosylase